MKNAVYQYFPFLMCIPYCAILHDAILTDWCQIGGVRGRENLFHFPSCSIVIGNSYWIQLPFTLYRKGLDVLRYEGIFRLRKSQ